MTFWIFRFSNNKCYVFSCDYVCVIYIIVGCIFNVASTSINSTSRLDDGTFERIRISRTVVSVSEYF